MQSQYVHDLILEIVADLSPGVDLSDINPSRSFRDEIALDSVDYINFVLSLEQRLGVEISESDYPKLSSLAGAEAYLQGLAGLPQATS